MDAGAGRATRRTGSGVKMLATGDNPRQHSSYSASGPALEVANEWTFTPGWKRPATPKAGMTNDYIVVASTGADEGYGYEGCSAATDAPWRSHGATQCCAGWAVGRLSLPVSIGQPEDR